MIAAEFDRVAAELRSAENYLTGLERRVAHRSHHPAEQVEAAMNLVADLIRVAEDPNARAEIRPLLEKLRLWIGLDFAWAIKGKKRKVRRLTGRDDRIRRRKSARAFTWEKIDAPWMMRPSPEKSGTDPLLKDRFTIV